MQAYACLYQWHRNYPLHTDPFSKLGSQKVLQLIQNFAEDFKLAEHTCFGQEVLSIKPEGSRQATWEDGCMIEFPTLLCNTRHAPGICAKPSNNQQSLSPGVSSLVPYPTDM